MFFHKLIVCMLFLHTAITLPRTLESLLNKRPKMVSTFETRNCFITYVLINGHRYLVKQKKASKKQISVIRDALAAYIAKDLKIAHSVAIIPYNKRFAGKLKSLWPATIHTIVPGETVRKQRNSVFNALRLRQWWAHVDKIEEKGLTKQIIEHMTWHKQLPIIVALDLMLGNSDRHCANLFYDPITDSFWAIDMDDTFNKDLCELAYEKLMMMIRDQHVVFTPKEIVALRQLRQTMHYLLHRHKVTDLVKKLHYFAKQAGFSPGTSVYNDSVERKLNTYACMIAHTWRSARNLIRLLDRIIEMHNNSNERTLE